jgi:hypothetical protein
MARNAVHKAYTDLRPLNAHLNTRHEFLQDLTICCFLKQSIHAGSGQVLYYACEDRPDVKPYSNQNRL